MAEDLVVDAKLVLLAVLYYCTGVTIDIEAF
jgi:hypothetical protein